MTSRTRGRTGERTAMANYLMHHRSPSTSPRMSSRSTSPPSPERWVSSPTTSPQLSS